MLAPIAVKSPADWLLEGVAALRLGERTAAMAALVKAEEPVPDGPPALPWTAKRLRVAAAGLPAR